MMSCLSGAAVLAPPDHSSPALGDPTMTTTRKSETHAAILTPEQQVVEICLAWSHDFISTGRPQLPTLEAAITTAIRSAYEKGKRDGCNACVEFVRGYTVAQRPPSELADALQDAAIRSAEAAQ